MTLPEGGPGGEGRGTLLEALRGHDGDSVMFTCPGKRATIHMFQQKEAWL